jgi:hypothetical protein
MRFRPHYRQTLVSRPNSDLSARREAELSQSRRNVAFYCSLADAE